MLLAGAALLIVMIAGVTAFADALIETAPHREDWGC